MIRLSRASKSLRIVGAEAARAGTTENWDTGAAARRGRPGRRPRQGGLWVYAGLEALERRKGHLWGSLPV